MAPPKRGINMGDFRSEQSPPIQRKRGMDMAQIGVDARSVRPTARKSRAKTSLLRTPQQNHEQSTPLQPSQENREPLLQPSLDSQQLSPQRQSTEESRETSTQLQHAEESERPAGTKNSGRGRAKQIKGWGKDKLKVYWSEFSEPLGDNAQKLSTQLGIYARNGYRFPLRITSWDGIDKDVKEAVWNEVKANVTNVPDGYKEICLSKLHEAWKRYKSKVKKTYYEKYMTDEERLANPPKEVEALQWRILVRYWGLSEVEEEASTNMQNRSMLQRYARTGRKPFNVIREERKQKNELVDKISMWRSTRQYKDADGNWVYSQHDSANQINAMLEAELLKLSEDVRNNDADARNEIYGRVVGDDGHGRVQTMGVGITPSCVRSVSSTVVHNARLEAELDKIKKQLEEREQARDKEIEERVRIRTADLELRFQADIEQRISKMHDDIEDRERAREECKRERELARDESDRKREERHKELENIRVGVHKEMLNIVIKFAGALH